jgi:hypothetical protein
MSSPLQELFDRLRDGINSLRQKLDFNRDHYYLTAECEPVLSVLKPGIAWTVKGRYGETLVTRNLGIWDVDFVTASSDISWLRDVLGEITESYRFRVYQTLGGLRVICTNRTVAYDDAISMAWFKELGEKLCADHRYMAISNRQLCSSASGVVRRLVMNRFVALNGLPSRVPVAITSAIQLVPCQLALMCSGASLALKVQLMSRPWPTS